MKMHKVLGETGASCYTGKLLQSKYLARWCIGGGKCVKMMLCHINLINMHTHMTSCFHAIIVLNDFLMYAPEVNFWCEGRIPLYALQFQVISCNMFN